MAWAGLRGLGDQADATNLILAQRALQQQQAAAAGQTVSSTGLLGGLGLGVLAIIAGAIYLATHR